MSQLGSKTKELIQEVDRYSAKNYNPLPIVISRAEGVWVWDVEGNKYLDCLSAYSAVNQGHRHPRIIQALKTQADLLTLTSRAFHNDQMGGFLRKICEISESEMALPMNTGAEAVETAFKAARKWGYQKKGVPSDSAEIIVCKNNFHGRTITIVSCSSEEQYRDGFGPFTPGFQIIEYGSLQALESAITPKTVAFFVEPIQGEAGILIPEAGFLTAAKKLCRKNNVLFMLDEIQTGLGRTGKLFAYQHEEDAKPDLLTLGKAISGGAYPVSVVVGRRDVLEVFNPGDHGSTFGGNPLGSAIAKEALQVILDEKLAERSWELGAHLMNSLKEIKSSLVREVRGKGLFVGVELATAARPYCEKLMKLGVLAKETHDSVIRLAPPLVISKEDLDWMISQVKKVLV